MLSKKMVEMDEPKANPNIQKSLSLIVILTYIFMVAVVIFYFLATKLPVSNDVHISSEAQLFRLKLVFIFFYLYMASSGLMLLNLGIREFLKKESYITHSKWKVLIIFLLTETCELGAILMAYVYYLYSNSKLGLGIMILISISLIYFLSHKLKAHLKSF